MQVDLSVLARWPAWIFLVGTMLGLGLQVAPAELLKTVRTSGVMLRVLIANCVVAPLLGVLAAALLPLSDDMRTGLLLVTSAPGGIAAAQFTSKAKESLSYATAVELLLTAAALVVAPLWLMALLGSATPLPVPIGEVLARLIPLLFLPLAIGFAIRSRWPDLGKRLARPVVLLGSLAFMANVVLTGSAKNQAVRALALVDVVVLLGLVVGLMAVGWVFGGPSRVDRRVLATATSFRNVAMALVIAVHWLPVTNVDTVVLAFSMLMIPPNVALMLLENVQAKRAARTLARV